MENVMLDMTDIAMQLAAYVVLHNHDRSQWLNTED